MTSSPPPHRHPTSLTAALLLSLVTVVGGTVVAPATAATAPKVFRTYSGSTGLRAELEHVARQYPAITKLETIGRSGRGVPIQALKVTRDANHVADGRRPAVLYVGAQHAREWITPEMVRRLLHEVVTGYGHDSGWTRAVDTSELWFLPVANPDGYDYSFTPGNREWRKNLRDNDGDGKITDVDGVDLNRNFDSRWGYDDEGSSPDPSDDTYRGPKAASEPETRALSALFDRVRFTFMVNYHSAARTMMYGNGWQVDTPEPDDQIAQALVGTEEKPAVPGYRPQRFAQQSTSNGDSAMYAQEKAATIGLGIEMGTCADAAGADPDDRWEPSSCESDFDFPDDEKLIQAEYAKNVPLARAVAASALTPANPVSPVGRPAAAMVATPFDTSYGNDQVVAVTARRSLTDLRLHYRIDDGAERTAPVSAWRGGTRYGNLGTTYYGEFRATVPGQHPGDRVSVWFTATGASTAPFTYTVNQRIGGDVLVLAGEDVKGINPANTDGATTARYVREHVDALSHAGRRADVYDIDAHGGRPPSALGVLSHYRTVLWESGDNVLPQVAGTKDFVVTDVFVRTERAVRDYLNEGGALILAGQHADSTGTPDRLHIYPAPGKTCTDVFDTTNCVRAGDDFQQYWLGVGDYLAQDGVPGTVTGSTGAFRGLALPLGRQEQTVSFLPAPPGPAGSWAARPGSSLALRWKVAADIDPDTAPDPESGPAVVTPNSVFLGFGLERLSVADRDAVVKRALRHLKR